MSFRVIDSSGWRWDGDPPPDPAPLTADQYARLLHLRARIAAGRVGEQTLGEKRLRFVRWCVERRLYRDD